MGFKESSEWLKLPLCIVLPRYAFTSLAVYLGSLPCGKDDANQTLSRWCYWIEIWQHLFALIIPSILMIVFLTTTVWNAVPNHYRHRLFYWLCIKLFLHPLCTLMIIWSRNLIALLQNIVFCVTGHTAGRKISPNFPSLMMTSWQLQFYWNNVGWGFGEQ